MIWSDLPPLSALRAFAAFADTGSVTAAGAALNVSHAAISQQMRALETHMNVSLLDRSGRALAFTAEGAALAQTLTGAFAEIATQVQTLTGAEAARPLHITCTPSFASNWLMPRLAEFRALHADIDIMLNPTPDRADPSPGGIDAAIRYGSGPWPGFTQEPLLPAPLVIVGAPSLLGDKRPTTPEDLATYPWLQELGVNEASDWLNIFGVPHKQAASITQVPGNLMIDGARNGQGLAKTTMIAVADDVASGRLIVLHQGDVARCYNLVTAPGVQRPPLRAFTQWLRRAAQKSKDQAQ